MRLYTIFLLLTSIFTLTITAQDRTTGEVVLRNDNVARVTIQLDIDNDQSEVTMTFTGPEDRWYGVGFDVGSSRMLPDKDCVYISSGNLFDAKIVGFQAPEDDNAMMAEDDWTVTSNTIDNGQRTVIAKRGLDTGDPDDYVFPPTIESLGLIYAHGRSAGATEIDLHNGAANAGQVVADFTVLDVKDIDASLFRIFPNPVANKINVQFEEPTSGNLIIMDYLGKVVQTEILEAITSKAIVVDNLSRGVYLAHFETAKGTTTKKFIKV